jgi:hypothetical protein
MARARTALNALADELDALARERKRADGDVADEKGAGKDASGEDAKGGGKPAREEEPVVRGALRIEKPASAFSALGSSAVLEVEVEASFDFVRERGRWRVARALIAGEAFDEFDALARALDQLKVARARADLDALASALEAFRADRGFYPVVDTASALNDHLSPRHLPAPVRFDPWHRPYEYKGERDSFILYSIGPDGKPFTNDDVNLGVNSGGGKVHRAGGGKP